MLCFEQTCKGIHLDLHAETTTAERAAGWDAKKKERQAKIRQAESSIPEIRPFKEMWAESTESLTKFLRKRDKEYRYCDKIRDEVEVLKETPLCENQWTNFQALDDMPCKKLLISKPRFCEQSFQLLRIVCQAYSTSLIQSSNIM